MEYLRTGPTPCVSSSHPSSSSIGAPQLPICTNSHAKLGLQDRLATFPCVQVFRLEQVQVFVVLPADHRVSAIQLAWEQRHSLVATGGTAERRHAKRQEILGFDQLRANRFAGVSRVRRVIRRRRSLEPHESRIFDPIRLRLGDRKDDPLTEVLLGAEHQLDGVPERPLRPLAHRRERQPAGLKGRR